MTATIVRAVMAPIVPATRADSSLAARETVRNASIVVVQRGVDLLASLAFAATIPRLLGPADFGRFALVVSVAHWFSLASGVGSTQIMGRFVPVLLLRDEGADARRLLGNLFALRLLTGVGSAALYLAVLFFWLPDLPAALLIPVAVGVVLRSMAQVPFGFFLGLNQAALWGAGELARRWSSLLLTVMGTVWLGVTGACYGIALAELFVLALGVRWVRGHLSASTFRLSNDLLGRYLPFGLAFLASDLLFALTHRGGAALVRAAGQGYAEVGYWGVAVAAYLAATRNMWHVLMSFLPLLARLRAEGRLAAAAEWAGRILKASCAIAMLGCAAAQLLGADLVRALAGPAFGPAAPLLVPFAVAVLAHAVGSVGRLMTLLLEKPTIAMAAALAEAATLAALGFPLVIRHGARGAAVAMAAASVVQAVIFVGAVRRHTSLPLGPSLRIIGLGAIVLPLAMVPSDAPWQRAGLFVLFVAGYAAALGASRLLTATELRAVWTARRRPAAPDRSSTADGDRP